MSSTKRKTKDPSSTAEDNYLLSHRDWTSSNVHPSSSSIINHQSSSLITPTTRNSTGSVPIATTNDCTCPSLPPSFGRWTLERRIEGTRGGVWRTVRTRTRTFCFINLVVIYVGFGRPRRLQDRDDARPGYSRTRYPDPREEEDGLMDDGREGE